MSRLCGAQNGWYCTLPAGHEDAEHVATIGLDGPVVFRWKDGDPPPTPRKRKPPFPPYLKIAEGATQLIIASCWPTNAAQPDPETEAAITGIIVTVCEAVNESKVRPS